MIPDSVGADPMETEIEICQSANVAARVIKELNLDKNPGAQGMTPTSRYQGLLGQISVNNILKSNVLSIRAVSISPKSAADLANAWAKCFIEAELDLAHEAASARGDFLQDQVDKMKNKLASPELRLSDESKSDQAIYDQLLSNLREARLAESNQNLGAVVVDPALPPDGPFIPQKRKILKMALFLGLFVGLQLALLLELLADRVRGPDKLTRVSGLTNLALIADFHSYVPSSVVSGNITGVKSLINNPVFATSEYLESFRVFRTNLTYLQTDRPIEAISILSPGRGEGKTLANANLALSLAQIGKKVLLVDADLLKPGLGPLFGVEPKSGGGLPAALAGQGPWKSMVVSSGMEHLDLLPNQVVVPNATELLSGESMKRFTEEAKKAYDYVVFDGAPILNLTDSLVLASLMDGVILLARWGQTRFREVGKSVEELASVKARMVGTVLNAVGREKGLVGKILPNSFARKGSSPWPKTAGVPLKKGFPPFQWILGLVNWFLP
jgi:capsular exopolysaccharide synthesis family protein